MPRKGAIIFRDLVGKLEVLNVECNKCGRSGRYHLYRLAERYGIDTKLFDWSRDNGRLPAQDREQARGSVRRSMP
jgi:hypothetical protein